MTDTLTGYISEFAKVIKENGVDILDTAEELEKVFGDALDDLIDQNKMEEMLESIISGFKAMVEEVDIHDIFSVKKLQNIFDELIENIEGTLKIDLKSPIDPTKIMETIKKNIPENIFPDEINKILLSIINFFDQVDLSDVRFSAKLIKEPVSKLRPENQGPSNFEALNIAAQELPSNFEVFKQQDIHSGP
ncbi:MAG: hypothetical protein AAF696_32015, partial [Bacteroidota bacterium]